MSIMKVFTLKNLTEQTIEQNKNNKDYRTAAMKAGGVNVTQCRAYDVPIRTHDLHTSIEIEYRSNGARCERAGITGTVFLTGELYDFTGPMSSSKMPLLTFYTNKSTREAHSAMFDVCDATARNIKSLLRKNANVTKSEYDLTVSIASKKNTLEASVRDLLRRKNQATVRTANGTYIERRNITKSEAADLLEQAKTKYAGTLTNRKQERADLLIQEYRGLRPTVKQYQRTLREQRAQAENT